MVVMKSCSMSRLRHPCSLYVSSSDEIVLSFD